jgi:hypothetical protein
MWLLNSQLEQNLILIYTKSNKDLRATLIWKDKKDSPYLALLIVNE